MDIKQLLARRSDLSTFLIHLTREYPEGTAAKDNLKSILSNKVIEARNAYGSAVARINKLGADKAKNLDTQKVVYFTETPLEHVRLLVEEIQGRKFKFGPYGIAISKRTARVWGVNPVWYLDISPGHHWLTEPLNKIIDKEVQGMAFVTSEIAQLTPFIEQMGTGEDYFKEYWWEREWRHVGDLSLVMKFIICPEEDFSDVAPSWGSQMPFIDPNWSLEQIIGHLARFSSEDIDPF